jgi:membrane-associated phospholipid phosphatase
MKQKLILIILFIIFCESPLIAQNKYTFPQFWNETCDFIMQPAKWDGNDYLKIGLICAGTGLLMFADQPIRNVVQKNASYSTSIPMESGRIWGDVSVPIILFGGLAAYSLITKDEWSRKVAYEIGQASLYTGGLVLLLKIGIGRARPFMNEGSASYHPFNSIFIQDYHSLPGGHNAGAFTLSTVLSRNVKPHWLKVLFYMPAALTFVSRIYQDRHWTSDDFMGAAIGYYIATWVVDKHENAVKSDSTETGQGLMDRIQLQPIIMGNIYGLNLSIRLY